MSPVILGHKPCGSLMWIEKLGAWSKSSHPLPAGPGHPGARGRFGADGVPQVQGVVLIGAVTTPNGRRGGTPASRLVWVGRPQSHPHAHALTTEQRPGRPRNPGAS